MSKKWQCPVEYYANCANKLKKCKACKAGAGFQRLFYEPVEPGLDNHPYQVDEKRQKVQRRAKHVEESIVRDIAKGTIRSGAVNGDGDIHLLNDQLRIEAKDRGERKSWNLTWAEFTKGLKQGIDIYAISVDCPDGQRRTMYMMENQLFTDWLALVKQQLDQANEKSTD